MSDDCAAQQLDLLSLLFSSCERFQGKGRRGRERTPEHGMSLPLALPCPSFPCFFFLGKKVAKTTKQTRIFYPYRTPKIPGKEGKNAQKNKDFLAGEKTRNSQKTNRVETRPLHRMRYASWGPMFLGTPRNHDNWTPEGPDRPIKQ